MRFSTLLTIAGTLAILFALGFLFAPGPTLAQYGAAPDPLAMLMSRFFGVALLHLGVLLWVGRQAEDPLARRAIAIAGVVGSLGGLVVALSAVLGHLVNGLGWSTVVIYLGLLLGYCSALGGGRPDRSLGRT
jgi:hypothetical protein